MQTSNLRLDRTQYEAFKKGTGMDGTHQIAPGLAMTRRGSFVAERFDRDTGKHHVDIIHSAGTYSALRRLQLADVGTPSASGRPRRAAAKGTRSDSAAGALLPVHFTGMGHKLNYTEFRHDAKTGWVEENRQLFTSGNPHPNHMPVNGILTRSG